MSTDPFEFLGDIEETRETSEANDVQPAGEAPDVVGQANTSESNISTTRFRDSYEFMAVFIGPQISRKISEQSGSGLRWDPDWWRYPEAVLRADLMWRSYEGARIKDAKDPSELEAWMRLVCDHHLAVLLNGQNGHMSSIDGPMPTLGATYPPDYGVISVENTEQTPAEEG